MIELRPYQTEAVASLFAYFRRQAGKPGPHNPLVVLPTGSGKSLVIAAFVKQAVESVPGTTIMIATHRAELIEQDAEAIRSYWPAADVGIYSAGLFKRQIRKITVGGVQSLIALRDLPRTSILIVDEAHLIPKEGDGQYRTLISRLTDLNPNLRVVGFTATPYRLAGGSLVRGKGKIFTSVVCDVPVQKLVDNGYLTPLVSPSLGVAAGYDTHKVKTTAGDYAKGELADSIEEQLATTRAAMGEAQHLASDRRSWLVFCVSVEHCRQVSQLCMELGISSSVIVGTDDAGSRKSKIDAFKRGDTRVLISCDILTTGFNAPLVDCIVVLRPTQSTALYVQAAGRGMRLAPGKKDCLVLDYGSNISRHGPITDLKDRKPKSGISINPLEEKVGRVCLQCENEFAYHKKECPECGAPVPPSMREITHEKTAERQQVMGVRMEEWKEIYAVDFEEHRKGSDPDAPPTLKVTYHVEGNAMARYREWVCPEHGGFARDKFVAWWKGMGGNEPVPDTVHDCLVRICDLRKVQAIVVEKDGKFDRVAKRRFATMREPGSDDVPRGAPEVTADPDFSDDLPF